MEIRGCGEYGGSVAVVGQWAWWIWWVVGWSGSVAVSDSSAVDGSVGEWFQSMWQQGKCLVLGLIYILYVCMYACMYVCMYVCII